MAGKTKLSKAILEMKFMKKTKEKVEKEDDDEEGRAMYSSEFSEKMLRGSLNYMVDPSFIRCEDLLEGRFSFRGMNPEIERLLELEEAEKQAKEEGQMQKDVSDSEMTQFYGNAAKTINRRFKKRKSDQNSNQRGKRRKHNKTEAKRKIEEPEPEPEQAEHDEHEETEERNNDEN